MTMITLLGTTIGATKKDAFVGCGGKLWETERAAVIDLATHHMREAFVREFPPNRFAPSTFDMLLGMMSQHPRIFGELLKLVELMKEEEKP